MIRRLATACALGAVLAYLTPAARAEFGFADPVPGATLLLPYFEVDLGDANGGDTVFKVFNSTARPWAIHVTLWTDWAVPTFGFDLVLGGYGSQEVFLREVFLGRIPESPAQFLSKAAELQGVSFSGCTDPLLSSDDVAHIRNAHTGLGSEGFGDRCSAVAYGDGVARGFITIDVVLNCAGELLPTSPGYFGAKGIAGIENVLWGYYALTNRDTGYAVGEMMVPLEADEFLSGFSFYANIAETEGADLRERLSPTWGGSYIGGTGGEGAYTEVILWRDPLFAVNPVPCGGTPGDFPFIPPQVSLSDEDGNTIPLGGFEPFPAATNRARIGDPEFPSIYDRGYARIDLQLPLEVGAVPSGIFIPFAAQGYATFVQHHGIGPASAHRASDLRVPAEP